MAFRRFLLAGALAAMAFPAQSQNVTASDPGSIVRAMHGAGYQARLTTAEDGNPQIDSGASGSNFSIFFFDCTDGRDCRAIQFHSSYEHPAPALEQLNLWNRETRYARGFISESGTPTIEMDVNLDAAGGISNALFLDNLDLFVLVMGIFEDRIGWE